MSQNDNFILKFHMSILRYAEKILVQNHSKMVVLNGKTLNIFLLR